MSDLHFYNVRNIYKAISEMHLQYFLAVHMLVDGNKHHLIIDQNRQVLPWATVISNIYLFTDIPCLICPCLSESCNISNCASSTVYIFRKSTNERMVQYSIVMTICCRENVLLAYIYCKNKISTMRCSEVFEHLMVAFNLFVTNCILCPQHQNASAEIWYLNMSIWIFS